jgi:hypothetical protein
MTICRRPYRPVRNDSLPPSDGHRNAAAAQKIAEGRHRHGRAMVDRPPLPYLTKTGIVAAALK